MIETPTFFRFGDWQKAPSPTVDLEWLIEMLKEQQWRPRVTPIHPAAYNALQIHALPPARRPRDYDTWLDKSLNPPKRPLKCTVCSILLSRNSPRRYGNPYCGPHFPGDDVYRLRGRYRR